MPEFSATSEPAYAGELTVIWDYEKAELHRRLDALEAAQPPGAILEQLKTVLTNFEAMLVRLEAIEARVFNLKPPSNK